MSLLPYLAGSKNFPNNSFNRFSILGVVSMWWFDWFSFDWLSFYLYSFLCWLHLQCLTCEQALREKSRERRRECAMKVMLHYTICIFSAFLVQHSITILLRHCLQHCSNIVTMSCAWNRSLRIVSCNITLKGELARRLSNAPSTPTRHVS